MPLRFGTFYVCAGGPTFNSIRSTSKDSILRSSKTARKLHLHLTLEPDDPRHSPLRRIVTPTDTAARHIYTPAVSPPKERVAVK
ncbi:hypothetical protein JOQ06_023937 [Pogonophryne albipinna]|uniref:Uncharacterized protein n=1 Tax=Pogonophryne albipinna TaxID=1090488 RepID=A0AAD6BJN6_9TELE|nr:hypothetical protein JOQ06_023937 [Pogonophryne albipinna]